MSSIFRLCRYTLCLVALFLFVDARGRLVAAATTTLGPCLEICDGSTDCSTECLYNLDSEETCGDWGTCAPDCSATCGPNVNCDQPCSGGGWCGNYNGGQANSECYGTCGDEVCQQGPENAESCEADCYNTCDGQSANECESASDCGSGHYCDSCQECVLYPAPPPPGSTCPLNCNSYQDCNCPDMQLPICKNYKCVDDSPTAKKPR